VEKIGCAKQAHEKKKFKSKMSGAGWGEPVNIVFDAAMVITLLQIKSVKKVIYLLQ